MSQVRRKLGLFIWLVHAETFVPVGRCRVDSEILVAKYVFNSRIKIRAVVCRAAMAASVADAGVDVMGEFVDDHGGFAIRA